MSKSLRNFIIGLGIASILFAVIGMYNGGEFLDALGGIVIGTSLIGVVLIEQKKSKKSK